MSRLLRAHTLGVALVLASFSCKPADPVVLPPDLTGKQPPRLLDGGLGISAIDSIEAFDRFSYRDGGLLLPGRTLKFLIDRRDPQKPAVYFMNSNFTDARGERPESAKYHFPFAERVLANFSETLKSFGAVTYDVQDKRYVAGSIQTYYLNGNTDPLYGIQFFPQDVAREEMIAETVRTLLPQFRIPGAKLAFVATGLQQHVGGEIAAELEREGAPFRSLDDVLGATDFIPLNRGEAWGFLRMFPKDPDALSPLDIYIMRTPVVSASSRRAAATSSAWSRDSIWHGPAISTKGR